MIAIDPRSRYNYTGYYILGLRKLFPRAVIKFDIRPFPKDMLSHYRDNNSCLAIMIDGFKFFIDADDKLKIDSSAYQWCDVYGKINVTSKELVEVPKMVSIGPSFGVTIDSRFCIILACIRNFISLRHYSDLTFKAYLKDYIYNDMSVIRKLEDNPSVSIYYVFCGNAPQDDHTESLKDIIKENLSKCSDSLSNINVSIIDGSELKKICKDLENDYSVELNIRDIIPLTVNDNNLIKKAYTFTCDAKEFLKLLRKDDDTIRRSLFNDNVRDYLGNKGVVNSEIEKTIINEPEMFLMCNNGITIVCSDFLQIRDKLVSIDNPQIVNGCQTCNSIFAQKENTSLEKVQLLIKLICTEDISITNKVVRGTNKQNQVLEESFESTKLFHQNLEDYFCAKIGEPRLYYERRNKQYSSIPTINKFQIVNLRVLTQTFVSMFLHLPYMAHRHEAKLLSEFACEDNRKIYVDNHSCTPYYICALTWYMFENAFRKNILPKKAKTYKAHLYYIFTFITGQYPLTCEMKKKSIDNFCDKLERVLLSNNFNNIAREVCQVFYYCKNEWEKMGKNRYAIKDTKDFTEFLCCKSREKFVNKTLSIDNNEEFIAPNTEWKEGKILTVKIKEGKWFAFISVDNNSSNVYFDDRAYKGDFNKLLPKVKVRFIQGKNRSNEYFAKQVQILKS